MNSAIKRDSCAALGLNVLMTQKLAGLMDGQWRDSATRKCS